MTLQLTREPGSVSNRETQFVTTFGLQPKPKLVTTPRLVLLCLVLAAPNTFAGKLSAVRGKTKNQSRANVNLRDYTSDREEQREAKSSRRSNSRGKLARVREVTRREPGRSTSPSSPPRQNDRPSRGNVRPPRRSGWGRPALGIGLGSGFSFDSCVSQIVEHHYYELPSESWKITESVSQQQFVAPVEPFIMSSALPPVMPPEHVVRGQLPEEPICEPIGCEPVAIFEEVAVGTAGWKLDPFQVRFEIDYAGDEEDVSRMGFGLLLNATNGLGIDTGARLFRERGADLRDHMWVGDFNVTYEFLATKVIRTRAGVGLNFLSDAYGGDAGLNLTVGSDVFLGPITLTGEADLGTIGDTDLFHGRVSAAIRCSDHLESFVGYDYLDIGGVEFSGLLAGVRFRY